MKFQAILPNRDFIMNCSLFLAKALQNAFPHRACRPKMPSWLGEEALLYAFPPSALPTQNSLQGSRPYGLQGIAQIRGKALPYAPCP